MKILIISPYFPPASGIAVVRISSLVRQMLSEGFEIKVLCNKIEKKEENVDEDLSRVQKVTVDVANDTYFNARRKYLYEFNKLMEKESFDLVLITMGPFYTIELCSVSEIRFDTPCILDFRDLWIFDVRKKTEFIKPINLGKKLLYLPIEYTNIKNASAIVTVTKDWGNILTKLYGIENKLHVIANGFDTQLINHSEKSRNYSDINNKFVIAVFGKLSYYSLHHGVEFFSAVQELMKTYPDIVVLHIGEPELNIEKSMKKIGFDRECYINTGFISYTEGISLIEKSNINILIDIRSGAMGTKIYDYIYANKPIVYFGKKRTVLAKEVNSFENGFVTFNKNKLIKTLKYIRENDLRILTSKTNLQPYTRKYQNDKYIELVKSFSR